MKKPEEYFEELGTGLADKYVHSMFDHCTWEEWIKYLSPYFEDYVQYRLTLVSEDEIVEASEEFAQMFHDKRTAFSGFIVGAEWMQDTLKGKNEDH